MQTSTIEQTVHFTASPHQVYQAIMDSKLHSEFSGAEAVIGKKVGDAYSAYDGHIEGTILELIEDKLIRKTWIAFEDGWPEGHASEVTFKLTPREKGTELHFLHTGVPLKKVESISKGWEEFYWEPMQAMFSKNKAQK